MNRRHAVLGLALSAALAFTAPARAGENTVNLENQGREGHDRAAPEIAPKHVKQLKTLIVQGFYDGLKFHRVIRRLHGPDRRPEGQRHRRLVPAEHSAEFSLGPVQARHRRHGPLGRAELGETPSSSSAWANSEFLNNNYTVVGVVTSGMDVVDKIKKGSKSANGSVQDPDKIVKMTLAK